MIHIHIDVTFAELCSSAQLGRLKKFGSVISG
jgi:hypothetical protein